MKLVMYMYNAAASKIRTFMNAVKARIYDIHVLNIFYYIIIKYIYTILYIKYKSI